MKKLHLSYSATVEKTICVPDEFYQTVCETEKSGDWWDTMGMLDCLFGYWELEKKGIYLDELKCIEDGDTEEIIAEF